MNTMLCPCISKITNLVSRPRSQMGRKESRPDHQRQEQLDWNNVPTKAAKIQERPDLSKLPTLNSFNSMSLGPPRLGPGGGMGNWSRGSSSNKKMSMQEVPLKQANRSVKSYFIFIYLNIFH